MKRKNLGKRGENQAVKELKRNKYKILERNWRSKFGEIDIIAQKGDFLVFVEVKTRWSKKFGLPEEAITPWKMERIIKTGEYYKTFHPKLPEAMRIDVVAINLASEGRIEEIRIIENVTG